MKIIKVVFSSLLAIFLVACTGVFILFQTFDPDQYLSKITKKFSLSLGRPVTIGHLSLGLSQRGITLDVWPLMIADDPDFTTQPFIKIDRVRIGIDLMSLIFRREVHVTGVLLQSPRVHIIRSQEGAFNLNKIGPIRSTKELGTSFLSPGIDNKNIPSSLSNIDTRDRSRKATKPGPIEIQDGAISFIDQQGSLDIWLKGIDATLKDFSLTEPFELTLEACLYSGLPNIQARLKVSWDQTSHSLSLGDLSIQADMSRPDINELKGVSSKSEVIWAVESANGIMELDLAHLNIRPTGEFDADAGDIRVRGVVIRDFNIINTLLSRTLGAFGGMQGSMDHLIKGQLREKLDARDTSIETARSKFSFHDKTLFIEDAFIQTDIFELSAKGSVDQGLNVDMQTTLHLNSDASDLIINEFKGLGVLSDDSKRITINAGLKGVFPHLKYKPDKDFRKKSKRALMQEGANILGALLGGGG